MPRPYIPNDKWSQRAAAEGYRARSVYKLMELDERFGLLEPGMKVVDLGAAPGSWLQYAAKQVGPEGKVFGIDLTAIPKIAENVITVELDIMNTEGVRLALAEAGIGIVDLVLSDSAPSTSGIKDIDQWRSVELAQAAFALALEILRPGGRCVAKILRGADFDAFVKEVRSNWKNVRVSRVQASRDRSREVYVIGTKS